MAVSSELQKHFDSKGQRSDIEQYLDDLNSKF
jgi:hypothetical protein